MSGWSPLPALPPLPLHPHPWRRPVEVLEHRARVMASDLHIVVVADAEPGREALDDVVHRLDHLEGRWSRFLPDSDITALNSAGGQRLEVDPATAILVTTMVDGWRATGTSFDPSILPTLYTAGYHTSIDDVRRVTILPDNAVHVGGYDTPGSMGAIEIDGSTVRLPVGLALDPGGIGKGLAADLAVGQMMAAGVHGAMVCIGGDLVVAGNPPGDVDGWVIQVDHPENDREIAAVGSLAILGGGVATSSTRSRRWNHLGADRHHLIDPRLHAQSPTDLASVTVVGRSGWLAEVHATAALLAGSDSVLGYLEQHDLSGLAVGLDGRVFGTADLRQLDVPAIR